MCGIAGLFGYPASADERRRLVEEMGYAIQYRGPDDRGNYVDDQVALTLQRLSVIDLAGGHQPMSSDDGEVHITYNGEVYNFQALRQGLERDGVRFRTTSDTEVILRLYEQRGLDACAALNGMFGFAIWDRRCGALHLVRDRMGVKPLYYYWNGRFLAFASEIKALVRLPAIERVIEPRAIWDYLTFRYVPGPQTIWRNIFKLPPAHQLSISIDGGPPSIRRWWSWPAAEGPEFVAPQTLLAEFASLFRDAVRIRMIADVPVGIMLSGGIDSSAVAAVAAEGRSDLNTFSVSFRDSPDTDERRFARTVAAHLGTAHHEIEIGEREFLDFLPRFVRYTDEPLADLASVPLYYVSQLARQTVTVALSGEGADEILGGYDFDRWWKAVEGDPSWSDLRAIDVPPHMTNYMDTPAKRELLVNAPNVPQSLDRVRQHLAAAGQRHPLDQMLYVYCQDWLVEDLLMKADRMSMASSLELRTPFLDYRLVEWAARAPLWAKLGPDVRGQWTTKNVLRQFAGPLLPAEVIERPKQGFPVPVYGWLSKGLKDYAVDLLLGSDVQVAGWFDARALQQTVSVGTAADAQLHDRHRLWNLMILELWARGWLKRDAKI